MPDQGETRNGDTSERLNLALKHVEMGFGAFSVWSTEPDGTCRCPKKGDCTSAGKHPIPRDGFNAASTDQKMVTAMMSAGSQPNYGLVWPLGEDIVFSWDIDGPDWREKMDDLAATFGRLPKTKTTKTPNGGLHLYYRWPQGVPIPEGNHLHGFIVRWPMKGYVVGPGSGINGRVYTSVGTEAIATLPMPYAAHEVKPARHLIVVSGEHEGFRLPGSVPNDDFASRHDAITAFVAHLWNRHNSFEVTDAAVRTVLCRRFAEEMPEPRLTDEIKHAWDTAEKKWQTPAGAVSAKKTVEQRKQESSAKSPFVIKPFTDYKHLQMQWAWDDWLPRGVVTLLDGNPGVGKSNIVIDIVARMSRMKMWPDGKEAAPRPMKTIYITREDDPATTLGPRLQAAGGDPSMVFFLEDEMVLPDDEDRLRALCVQEQPDIVVIDPIFSHISADVKTISDNDARVNVMNPLSSIADEIGCVMLILRHFNKQVGSSALNRGAGSLGGFVGAARQVLAVTHDPDSEDDNPLKVFGVVKSNYGPTSVAMKYAIEGFLLPGWTKTVSRIRWEGVSNLSVDDILRDANPERSKGATDAIADVLAKGGFKMKPADVIAGMKTRGFGRAAVYNAVKRAGIQIKREGFPSHTVWVLVPDSGIIPSDDPTDEGDDNDESIMDVWHQSKAPAEPRGCLFPADHHKKMTAKGIYSCPICKPSHFSTKDNDDAHREGE